MSPIVGARPVPAKDSRCARPAPEQGAPCQRRNTITIRDPSTNEPTDDRCSDAWCACACPLHTPITRQTRPQTACPGRSHGAGSQALGQGYNTDQRCSCSSIDIGSAARGSENGSDVWNAAPMQSINRWTVRDGSAQDLAISAGGRRVARMKGRVRQWRDKRRRGSQLTGERPIQGRTPDSLLALHDAGYREVIDRLQSAGVVVDIGSGVGDETVRLAGDDRFVIGVDYFVPAAVAAQQSHGTPGAVSFIAADGAGTGLATGCAAAVCSSHIIEHFTDPSGHVAELARLTADDGAAFVLTPNKPADFENPYHVYLFEPEGLARMLAGAFDEVTVFGMDASQAVKDDFAARRATGEKILKIDVFDLRHKLPRRWYIKGYELGLKVVYRVLGDRYSGGSTGITDADFFIADDIEPTTPVLFAVARRPKRAP